MHICSQLQLKLVKLFHGDDDDPDSTSVTSQCLVEWIRVLLSDCAWDRGGTSLLDATMNTAPSCQHTGTSASSRLTISTRRIIDNSTGLAATNAELAATIESGPCYFQGCECTSGHVCQGSCGFYLCITHCDEKLARTAAGGLWTTATTVSREFLRMSERVHLHHGLHRVDGDAEA
jgi:hypothetical protein